MHGSPIRLSVIAWVLCIVFFGFTAYSPHCNLCDGIPQSAFPAISQTQKPSATHPHSSVLDRCNGVCSCCALQGLPSAALTSTLIRFVQSDSTPEIHFIIAAPTASLFRPPRSVSLQRA